jgi:S1-C subfamily serine protease
VWAADLVVSANFHTPDRTRIGLPRADGELDHRDAEVIGRDPGTDVALLRVTGGGLAPATLHAADDLAVGTLALALGRPGRSVRASLRMVGVLGGSVRTPHGGKLDRYIETDRQIPRGFAGGPLVDGEGAVLGMNTRTLIRGTDLAVPIATLRRVVDELVAHGGVRRGHLGVGAYPAQLTAALLALVARAADVGDGAAMIASVDEAGPAAVAGLAVGDLIVALDGEPITDPSSLRRTLFDRPGKQVAIVALRSGARLDLTATLGAQ